MTPLSSQAIAQYRSQLAAFPDALEALDTIEDCEGDLEDAALSLGIRVGQEPQENDWLDLLAKRCRVAVCEQHFQEALLAGNVAEVVEHLMEIKLCHPLLVVPIVLFVAETGVQQFCEPLAFKLSYDN
ncbi:MAG: hypothetical protein ACKN9E_16655 [Microcystaceae cyanobacterium]